MRRQIRQAVTHTHTHKHTHTHICQAKIISPLHSLWDDTFCTFYRITFLTVALMSKRFEFQLYFSSPMCVCVYVCVCVCVCVCMCVPMCVVCAGWHKTQSHFLLVSRLHVKAKMCWMSLYNSQSIRLVSACNKLFTCMISHVHTGNFKKHRMHKHAHFKCVRACLCLLLSIYKMRIASNPHMVPSHYFSFSFLSFFFLTSFLRRPFSFPSRLNSSYLRILLQHKAVWD